MENYTQITKCRVCGSKDLTEVLSIEPQYLSPTFVKSNEGNPLAEIKIPLTMVLCDTSKNPQGCGLLQLRETVNPQLLYKDYFYRSATSNTMREDLADVVKDVMAHIDLKEGQTVVDIGANDGTMISYFPANLKRIGVEPAKNIIWEKVDPSITRVNDFFSKEALKPFVQSPVRAITACAMFYDLDDPNSFVKDLKSVLAQDGIICLQLTYLPGILENANYDMCNEHLEYYSLEVLQRLMQQNGLDIFDAKTNPVNGGSIRIFLSHSENPKPKSGELTKLLAQEKEMKLQDKATYASFYQTLLTIKDKANSYIDKEINRGNLVIGLGASTKGNGILQMFGIGKEKLPFISERNPEKFGLRTLGTDIEIISEEEARAKKPAVMVVLPWHFKKEIVAREKEYLNGGGKLLFLMPYCHIVSKEGEATI